MNDEEYSLSIDDQVQKFLELKHKLTFFLISAAVGSLGFTLAFSIERFAKIAENPYQSAFLYAGTVAALAAVGAALLSLHHEIKSYQLHLRYRYERRSWHTLSQMEQIRWGNINKIASKTLKIAFVLIMLSIIAQSAVFVFDLHGEEVAMHHYGEDSTEVTPTEFGFNVVFRNKQTGQEIKMYIPRAGVLENANKGIDDRASSKRC